MPDDPKFRALLLRREQGCTVPEYLWPDGEAAPLDGIVMINQMHSGGRITFKEWLRYVREWTENVAAHYGSTADMERVKQVPRPEAPDLRSNPLE
jgi:hypothetical protein